MAEKLHEWQSQFKLKDELLQGDFYNIEMALFDMPNIATFRRHSDMSIVNGAWLKAAIKAGWIEAPECKAVVDKKNKTSAYIYDGVEVDSLHPAKVAWLGKQVIDRHDAVMSEDPKN